MSESYQCPYMLSAFINLCFNMNVLCKGKSSVHISPWLERPSNVSKGLPCSACSQYESAQQFLRKIQMGLKAKSQLLSKKGQQQLSQLTKDNIQFHLFLILNIFLAEIVWWLFLIVIFFQKHKVILSRFQRRQNSTRTVIISSKTLTVKLEKRKKKGERKVEK